MVSMHVPKSGIFEQTVANNQLSLDIVVMEHYVVQAGCQPSHLPVLSGILALILFLLLVITIMTTKKSL